MGNSYFRFKQFTVSQAQSGMKVTTDACVLGAWAQPPDGAKRTLDIGAGTGILSLMIAQRYPAATIDAVEYDEKAAAEARANFSTSPWSGRLNLIEHDIRSFSPPYKYDFIISNPPFFTNSLLGPDSRRNAARHTLSLSTHELADAAGRLLADSGRFCVLLPFSQYEEWRAFMISHGWFQDGSLYIRSTAGAPAGRVVSCWSRGGSAPNEIEILTIKTADNNYTNEFVKLLSAFYLYL